jgi:dihydrodipicolinate synthase/N-acetylneuraminate lyase
MPFPALQPGRPIEGISAVLLPFDETGRIDWDGFHGLVERTWTAGLTPAVNMDTGYVNLLTAPERAQVLADTQSLAAGRRFVAGAFIEGEDGDAAALYRREIETIRAHGGLPIIFQSSGLTRGGEAATLDIYRRIGEAGGPLLAFELGTMFAPFGRIYSTDMFRRLLDIEAFAGLKHSSLDRAQEWDRLALRDRHRPEFRVYTGNDLAIDMVFYGSDYLLGVSAFAVEAFAARDRAWAACDRRAFALNDVLQYLGQVAFRAPVPAYKHSAAQFLKLRGLIASDRPHPKGATRPDSDRALLADIRDRLDVAVAAAGA